MSFEKLLEYTYIEGYDQSLLRNIIRDKCPIPILSHSLEWSYVGSSDYICDHLAPRPR